MKPPRPPRFDPIIGHRGAAGLAPENTLAGLAKAAELGLGWVEFDVMLSADGVPILFHDDTLERTTDGSGPVALHDFVGLRALDAGAWFSPAYVGERIPTLDEAIAALDALGLAANIEIKPAPGQTVATAEAVARRLAAGWPSRLPPPIVSSFQAAALEAAQRLAPYLPRGLLVGGALPRDWQAQAERLGCASIHCAQSRLTARAAAAVRGAGFHLMAYTVNSPARAQALFAYGVEAVFTDWPDRVRPPAGSAKPA